MRRGEADISFPMWMVMPLRLRFLRSATLPIIVAMQAPSADPTRSVGEKVVPLPPLSTGASVRIAV